MSYDPDGVGVHNGNIFGFPVSEKEAELVIIPVPWDVTASYKKGTSRGPGAILEASVQLDFYHPWYKNAGKSKIYMSPISLEWLDLNDDFNNVLRPYFEDLENGEDVTQHTKLVEDVNDAQAHLSIHLENKCVSLINAGKKVAVLGGEHSVPLGLLRALKKIKGDFGVLQIDAHADLRDTYEGFNQSHASIMHNVLNESLAKKITAVGVRDLSEKEMAVYEKDARCTVFTHWDIKTALAEGKSWKAICVKIVNSLPEQVYISFDIDGLSPELCPNTGTPVPGGMSYDQACMLLKYVVESGKEIIGFDLCEVALGSTDWDANVGARMLWELSLITLK